MVVEDEILIAADLCEALEAEGYEVLPPAETLEEAHEALRGATPGIVVLDASLDGESAAPVAEELTRRGIPFVYVSGYAEEYLNLHMPRGPVLRKPVKPAQVIDYLRGLSGTAPQPAQPASASVSCRSSEG
jgi:DNA-binding response OmpR family regulator